MLPIEALRSEFVEALARRSLLVVCAPTGSGKSTCLPRWMAEQRGRVLVVEPRRVACRALATYLAEQRGEAVGASVGYRVRFETRCSAATQIEFVTPGVALRLLRDEEPPYDAYLIDEFHERQWEIDLLLALLRSRQLGPLVLTSATIAGRDLAAQLGALLLEAEGRTYPVEIHYADEPKSPSSRDLEERVVAAVRPLVRAGAEGEDILVFLPGKGEIDGCCRALEQALSGLDVMPIHASLPMERLSRAFSPEWPRRRIYVSTNVAETSLTLPRVRSVVDAGLVRMRIHRGGRSALALLPATQAQMDQRAGRAGRVAEGRCLRLWRADFRPQEHTPPAIERIELDDLVLHAAAYGLQGEALLTAPWVSPPPEHALEAARARLRGIQALDHRDHLTAFGRDMCAWPVSAVEASLLVGAPPPLASALADLVALLQRHGPLLLSLPSSPQLQAEISEARQELLGPIRDEVMASLQLLRHGDPRLHHLHASGLRQSRDIARQLRKQLGLRRTNPAGDPEALPDADALASWLLGRVPELGFVRRPRADRKAKAGGRRQPTHPREPWANGQIELMLEPYLPPDPTLAPERKPKAGVILAHTWVGERGLTVRGRGRMLLPCSPRVLAHRGLGDLEIESPRIERKGGETLIFARLAQRFAGVALDGEEQLLQGASLRQVASAMIAEGRLFSGAWEEILDDLHMLALLSAWPTPKEWTQHPQASHWHEDPQSYLLQRLEQLGLETCEELALLEAEDLRLDLGSALDIDPYTLRDLQRDFPRIWEHQGRSYLCHIQPSRRHVRLEPLNANARKGRDPQAKFLPSFRGFRVSYQRASRIVQLR